MLRRLVVNGFKSLSEVGVEFPRMTVLFGPNAAGKSNLLEAIQALSRVGTSRTLSEALSEPIRGYPVEAFSFPSGGLAALLSSEAAQFSLEADLDVGQEHYRYKVAVEIQPSSGSLAVRDEYLATLNAKGELKGSPAIEVVNDKLCLRRKSHPGRPRYESLGENYTILSDLRLGGAEYRAIDRCRTDLLGWRSYYLDPRVAMRSARPPADVRDIGVLGEDIAPFLYRLRAEKPKHFEAVKRTLRSLSSRRTWASPGGAFPLPEEHTKFTAWHYDSRSACRCHRRQLHELQQVQERHRRKDRRAFQGPSHHCLS